MPRFGDDWVIDRSLFEFVNGGSCACCSFQNFLPDGVNGLIQGMSDMETDAAQAEISALPKSPWPAEMRQQVWGDRARLRHKLKREMPLYQQFWRDHGEEFSSWCHTKPVKVLQKMWQMPRSEVTDRLQTLYGIGPHTGTGVVFRAVMEQVANFPITKYPTDGRGESEIAFEQILGFDRRGGYTIKVVQAENGRDKDEIVSIVLNRIQSLGGPKLLDRAPRREEEDEDGDADDVAAKQDDDEGQTGPSFRSDRRLLRLLIARYWADNMMAKYLQQKEKASAEKQEKEN